MSGAEDSVSGLLDGPRLSQALPSIALLLASGSAELVLGYQVFAHSLGMIFVLAVHVGSVSLAACGLWLLPRQGSDYRLSVFGVIAMAGSGPLGAAAALLTFLLHGLLRRGSESVDNRFGQFFYDLQEPRAGVLAREIAEGRVSVKPTGGVVPFVDVMKLGRLEQKQALISRISTSFRPGFAELLWGALHDPEPTLRVEAATVASRIERNFELRCMELERRLSSGDTTIVPVLATHLERMADSGLIDDQRSRAFRERALNLWQSIEGDASNDLTDQAIVRGLLRLGRPYDACMWFERRDRGAVLIPSLAVLRFEALFLMCRYTELRELCAHYWESVAASTVIPIDVRAAVQFWGTAD